MTLPNIPFKSYCWNIGTTSYRTKQFNFNIEKQLSLLDEFWNKPENINKNWTNNNSLQKDYYNFLKENKFVVGNAKRPDKDAREKTSGLVEIGLIDNDRKLTQVGKALLEISKLGNFDSDNELNIAKDSYIYLKQLLKMSTTVENKTVRPLILLIYFLSKLEYLTKDEFCYILPLCVDNSITQKAINFIKKIRNNEETIDNFIIDFILNNDTYRKALDLFINNKDSEKLITTIGINRKSRTYDKPYYNFYETLKEIALKRKLKNNILKLYKQTEKINGKAKNFWKKYLFSSTEKNKLQKEPLKCLKENSLLNKNKTEFKKEFFKLLHLFKIKSTLSDYLDLNRRYFKLTDIIIFEDEKIKLDTLPYYYFKNNINELYNLAFTKSDILEKDCNIAEICNDLIFDEKQILHIINSERKSKYSSLKEFTNSVNDERYVRFKNLISTKFSNDKILNLLEMFETRNDDKINELVTYNADIPTIFEYILGIVWYKISEYKGKILDYMNLSLDADLLPKTHAVGGSADIIYKYDKTDFFPKHTLLLEATLTNNQNQRRAEIEPVSRHLGDYLLQTGDSKSYCIFISNFLAINVVSDFINRKTYHHYSNDGTKSVTGLKIVPLQTSELKTIIKKGLKYKNLYLLFDKAYLSNEKADTWYNKNIVSVL